MDGWNGISVGIGSRVSGGAVLAGVLEMMEEAFNSGQRRMVSL